MPNTHRRRRRDATVELSRVGVGGVNLRNTPKTDQFYRYKALQKMSFLAAMLTKYGNTT